MILHGVDYRVTEGYGNCNTSSSIFFFFLNIHVSECASNGFPWAVGSNVFCVKPLSPVGCGDLPQ